MKNISIYVKHYIKYIILCGIVIGVQTLLTFLGPVFIRQILQGVEVGQTGHLKTTLLAFVFAFIAQYGVQIGYNFLYTRFSYTLKTRESRDLFHHFFKVDYKFLRKLDPTYFVTRIKNSVDYIFDLIGGNISSAIISFTTVLISLYLILFINKWLFCLFLILLPINFFSYRILNQKLLGASKKLQFTCANEFKDMINIIQNVEEIKQIYKYEEFKNRIGQHVDAIEKKNNEVYLYSKVASQAINFVIDAIKNGILLVSIYFYVNGSIIFADVMFINMILSIYFSALSSLNKVNLSMRDVRAAFDFINEEIITREEADFGEKSLGNVQNIEFNIPEFGYETELGILRNINIQINTPQKIAIVGKSGCGKSTMVKLLTRLFDSEGIKVNGHFIQEYSLKSLREKVFLVSQSQYLFPGTIKQNITIGLKDYDEDALEHILNLSFLKEFQQLPNGMDTVIREGGSNFSGGQKQKIMIARMLLHNPDVIIFDESTSALDSRSEDQIMQNIDEVIKNKIVITISHRLSTIRNVDRIIVLQNGRISEVGSFNELLTNSKEFNELFATQLKAI